MEGDKSTSVLAIIIIFFVLTYVSVGLRTFTRLRINKSFGVDDVMVLILLVKEPQPARWTDTD